MIWPNEASRGHANLCCAKGRSCNCEAIFPIPPPQPLRDLLTSEPAPGAHLPLATVSFRKHIRKYNSSLQMASSGINIQSPADGVSMIAIRGAVHHLLGPLAPPEGRPHQFAQLYIIDNADAQVVARFATFGQGNVDLDRRTLQELQQMLLGSNVYVQRFVQAMDLPPQDLANYEILICVDGSVDRRRYNTPTSSEVAGLILGRYCLWFPGAREARLWMPVSRGLQSFGTVLKCVTCMKTCVFRGFWRWAEPSPRSMPNNSKLGRTIYSTLGRVQSKSFLRLGKRLF